MAPVPQPLFDGRLLRVGFLCQGATSKIMLHIPRPLRFGFAGPSAKPVLSLLPRAARFTLHGPLSRGFLPRLYSALSLGVIATCGTRW
jgi:hypothetical protein